MANKKPWEDEGKAANQAAFADAQKRAAAQLGEQLDAANLTGAGSAAIDRVRKYRQSTPGQTANMGQTANQAAVDKASKDLVSKDLMDEYLNRGKFSYNAAADPLYQQYKDQYLTAGNIAMKDTMGKAATLTGGYGNTYAQTVGQQVYDDYAARAADKIPELYQLALDRYNQEGQDILNRYELLYGRERDAAADEQWQKQFDESVRQFDLNRADQREQFAESMRLDWAKFEEGVRQFGLQHALDLAKYDRSIFESDRNYNRSVFESDRAYDRNVYESDRDYALNSYKVYNSGSNSPSKTNDPGEDERYNENGIKTKDNDAFNAAVEDVINYSKTIKYDSDEEFFEKLETYASKYADWGRILDIADDRLSPGSSSTPAKKGSTKTIAAKTGSTKKAYNMAK